MNELHTAVVAAYEAAHGGPLPAGIAKTAAKMVEAILARDESLLGAILYKDNKISRQAFEVVVLKGEKLPKTINGTNAVVKDFLGALAAAKP